MAGAGIGNIPLNDWDMAGQQENLTTEAVEMCIRDRFRTVAETLMEFSDCSLEAGAEGIFYAALGGERNFFTDEEFEEFVAPYEKMVYDLSLIHI